jgi:hypothetical protein
VRALDIRMVTQQATLIQQGALLRIPRDCVGVFFMWEWDVICILDEATSMKPPSSSSNVSLSPRNSILTVAVASFG